MSRIKVFSGQRALMDGPKRHPRNIMAGCHFRKLINSVSNGWNGVAMCWRLIIPFIQSTNFIWMIQWLSDHASAITMHIKIASLVFKILLHALVCILSQCPKQRWMDTHLDTCMFRTAKSFYVSSKHKVMKGSQSPNATYNSPTCNTK